MLTIGFFRTRPTPIPGLGKLIRDPRKPPGAARADACKFGDLDNLTHCFGRVGASLSDLARSSANAGKPAFFVSQPRANRHYPGREDAGLIHNPQQYRKIDVGVIVRRRPGVTRWQRWTWTACSIWPDAPAADWRELRRDGDNVEYHAATLALELHGSDTEAYRHELAAQVPSVYVIMRATDGDPPLEVIVVTASPYEAQDYADSGEEIIERIPMSPALLKEVHDFARAFHEEEPFRKRKRDKQRVDAVQDGIGDARIDKPADVYASPELLRRRLI